MTEPTDSEIKELIAKEMIEYSDGAYADHGSARSQLEHFASAVLAKWGTPPAVAGEPVAWMGTYDKTDLYYRKPPQADVVPLYTTPQPTQAQPVAREPLTDEHLRVIERMHVYAHTATLMDFARAIERAHGITGGQHGTESNP